MNRQRFICVWLDNGYSRSSNCVYAQDDLRTTVDSFRSFNEFEECLDYLIQIENINVILIIVDVIDEQIIPIIHSSNQLHSIYILTENVSSKNDWIKQYEKIQGAFNDMKMICQKIKEHLKPTKNTPTGISFLSSADIHSHDVNRQDPSFMYSQLLKEILLNDDLEESDEESKCEMVDFCRKLLSNDQEALTILNEFDENFLPELSVYWYTRECFLYRMLNKALWTPQPDVLYKLRYFLRHLHQQIVAQAKLQPHHRTSIIVYRGQNIPAEQVQRLKHNVGGFLSFNNFLSTSLKRTVALSFLPGSQCAVLFEMYIDTTIDKFPFANIDHLSMQQGTYTESELLFSMGTVFRIVGMDIEDDFHRVQLMLTADIDEQLADYTSRTREDIRSTSSFLALLKLMYTLCQYDSIEQFARIFHDDAPFITDPELLDVIHNTFGLIHHNRGQLTEALEHFHQSLNICLVHLPADHPKLAITYNNIGSVHSSQSDYQTALTYHQLALDCVSNAENPNVSAMISYTNNIGGIYDELEKYPDALTFFKRALDLQREYLGEDDPSLTDTYNRISLIYYKLDDYEQTTSFHQKAVALQEDTARRDPDTSVHCSLTTGALCISQGQYDEALEHFNGALRVQLQYMLPNNPALAMTYAFIADVYFKQELFEQSLSYHIKALQIEQNSLPDDHTSIGTSYMKISKDYVALSFWSDALEYAFKAIEQINKSSEPDFDTLVLYTVHLANIYYQREEYEKALVHFKEALDLCVNRLPTDDPSLSVIYYRSAESYYKLSRYAEALPLYQKTLDIELKTTPDDGKAIAISYKDLSASCLALGRYDEALINAREALDQLLKIFPYNHPEVIKQQSAFDTIERMQLLRQTPDQQ